VGTHHGRCRQATLPGFPYSPGDPAPPPRGLAPVPEGLLEKWSTYKIEDFGRLGWLDLGESGIYKARTRANPGSGFSGPWKSVVRVPSSSNPESCRKAHHFCSWAEDVGWGTLQNCPPSTFVLGVPPLHPPGGRGSPTVGGPPPPTRSG